MIQVARLRECCATQKYSLVHAPQQNHYIRFQGQVKYAMCNFIVPSN